MNAIEPVLFSTLGKQKETWDSPWQRGEEKEGESEPLLYWVLPYSVRGDSVSMMADAVLKSTRTSTSRLCCSDWKYSDHPPSIL